MAGYDPGRPRRASSPAEPAQVDAIIDLADGVADPATGGDRPRGPGVAGSSGTAGSSGATGASGTAGSPDASGSRAPLVAALAAVLCVVLVVVLLRRRSRR